jgi:small subunit ribosomal protein S6
LKNYDFICIIKTNLDIDGVDQVVTNIENTIANFGGSIVTTEKIGRKKLAYEVTNYRDGFYVNFVMNVAEEKITEIKRYLKLNENILRAMITVQEKVKAAVK